MCYGQQQCCQGYKQPILVWSTEVAQKYNNNIGMRTINKNRDVTSFPGCLLQCCQTRDLGVFRRASPNCSEYLKEQYESSLWKLHSWNSSLSHLSDTYTLKNTVPILSCSTMHTDTASQCSSMPRLYLQSIHKSAGSQAERVIKVSRFLNS